MELRVRSLGFGVWGLPFRTVNGERCRRTVSVCAGLKGAKRGRFAYLTQILHRLPRRRGTGTLQVTSCG